MRCPYRAWDRERGRRSGIGDTIEAPYRERGRRPVSETRSRHRIGSAVGGRYRRHDRGAVSGTRSAAGIGNTIEAPYRERGRRPVSETQSRHRIGNAVGGRYRRHDRGTVSGTRSAAGIGNAVVPFALNGATHTSPGHRPGNYIPDNQCVLKEHRIGRVGAEEMKTES